MARMVRVYLDVVVAAPLEERHEHRLRRLRLVDQGLRSDLSKSDDRWSNRGGGAIEPCVTAKLYTALGQVTGSHSS